MANIDFWTFAGVGIYCAYVIRRNKKLIKLNTNKIFQNSIFFTQNYIYNYCS